MRRPGLEPQFTTLLWEVNWSCRHLACCQAAQASGSWAACPWAPIEKDSDGQSLGMHVTFVTLSSTLSSFSKGPIIAPAFTSSPLDVATRCPAGISLLGSLLPGGGHHCIRVQGQDHPALGAHRVSSCTIEQMASCVYAISSLPSYMYKRI